MSRKHIVRRKNSLPLNWTVEDWKDFYYTLKAFKERLIARHTAQQRKFKRNLRDE